MIQETEHRPPKRQITDAAELRENQLRHRKKIEDSVRRTRQNKRVWMKYAIWEESQKEFDRARSVWERALEIDHRDHTMWLKYAEFEMKNKFVNHARNVWDRAVELLPRVDHLWYKYIHMEEMLGNVAGARQIFERWMKWIPDQQGWLSYIKFELRYKEVERARAIFERFVDCHPIVSSWIRFAKFEMKNGEVGLVRNCYKRAVDKLGNGDEAEELYMAFAEFEDKCKKTELFFCNSVTSFENQYWDAILDKRRVEYEDEVTKNPINYDVWFDYIRLEESCGVTKRIEDVYELAIANVPPSPEKKYWQRYIYLWINYVMYEEKDAQDVDRTKDLYNLCLKTIPHKYVSFAKVWVMAALFEIRQLNIDRARRILGLAIGMAPKDEIFNKYIEIEQQLGNIERCRKLYEKYLDWSPDRCHTWSKFVELERSLAETERARAIYELAIGQPALDMPELLWKDYIDFEISESKYERARALYERLLDCTKHLKVLISYAKFEASAMEENFQHLDLSRNEHEQKQKCLLRARDVLERAFSYFRTSAPELKEERAMLLNEWLNIEGSFGDLGDVDLVRVKLPKKLKKRKHVETQDCSSRYEEYIDYVFPDETQKTNIEILEAAYKWKKQKTVSV